jgi:hypothetical protein
MSLLTETTRAAVGQKLDFYASWIAHEAEIPTGTAREVLLELSDPSSGDPWLDAFWILRCPADDAILAESPISNRIPDELECDEHHDVVEPSLDYAQLVFRPADSLLSHSKKKRLSSDTLGSVPAPQPDDNDSVPSYYRQGVIILNDGGQIVFGEGQMVTNTVNIGDDNIIMDSTVIAGKIQDSFNSSTETAGSSEIKAALKELHIAVARMCTELEKREAEHAADSLKMLTREITSGKPEKKWYHVSAEGLMKAAEAAANTGGAVLAAVGKLLNLVS